MIGGLYSRFGNTTGAFASVFAGSGISVSGIILQQKWARHIYPFLQDRGWDESVGSFLAAASRPFNPYIVWEISPEKFPINSYEIFMIAMISGIIAYTAGSLVTYRGHIIWNACCIAAFTAPTAKKSSIPPGPGGIS